MHRRQILVTGAGALASAVAVAAAPAALAGSSAKNAPSVRVEGRSKTLVPRTDILAAFGTVRRAGHSCSAKSGAGALTVATKGKWSGTWSGSLHDFEVLTILGDTEAYTTTKSYWEVFVNDVAATTGICAIKLKAGERLLFAAVGASEVPGLPIGLKLAGTDKAGKAIAAKVVYYTAKGVAKPLAGATVTVGGKRGKTGSDGTVELTPTKPGTYTVTAGRTGYIRDEATLTVTG